MRKYLSFLEGMELELKQSDEVTTKDFLVSYLCLRDKVLDCRSPQPLSPAPNQHIAPSFGDCGEVVFTESKISEMRACTREEQDLPGGDIFLAASVEPQAQLLYGKGFRCGHTNTNAGSSPTGSHIRLLATGLSEIVGRAGCTDTFPSCIA